MKWRQVVCGVAAAFALAGCASVATPPRAGIAEGAYPAPLLDQTAERPQDKERKARIDLALAYLELGRVDVALDEIAKARALDASDPLVPYAWGLAHLALGDRATAEKSLEEAQRLAPNDPDILHALGSLRCTVGRFEEGLALLHQAAMNPYYPRRARSLANHAWCAWRAGDESAVQNEIDMALALQPDDFVRTSRYEHANRERVMAELAPAVLELARTLPVASEADGDQPWCDRSATVRDALRTEFEEQMVTRHSDGTQLWGSDVMGTWTVVLSRPDDTQCVIASGIGYAAGENPATYLAKVGLG